MLGKWPSAALLCVVTAFAQAGAARGQQADSLVAEMTRRVDRTDLEVLLKRLTGELPVWVDGEEQWIETRYSDSDDLDVAGRFLAGEFERLGLEIRLQEYLGHKLEDVAFADSLHGWAVGDLGAILRTDDGGKHWVRQEGTDESLYGVAVLSPQRAVAVARFGLVYRTEDGGQHWAESEIGSRALRAISFVDSSNGWACGDRGTIVRTRNGGIDWEIQSSSVTKSLYSIAFADSSYGWAVGATGHVLRTRDGGRTWGTVQLDGQPALCSVRFLDRSVGWTGGDGGHIFRTLDGGDSWQDASLDIALTVYDLWFRDPAVGWAACEDGYLYETDDGGHTWTLSISGVSADLRGIFVGEGRAWIVGEYTILESPDFVGWHSRVSGVEGKWTNVEATLPGVAVPDESYVLCGHYDSISEISRLRAPGADDNASGTALVVAAARALSLYQFEKTLKFVCFSGEEQGLRGSFNYVVEARDQGTLPAGVINADMVGYDTGAEGQIAISPADELGSLSLAQVCSTTVGAFDLPLAPSLAEAGLYHSDHLSFSSAGVPSVMLGEAGAVGYPYIHSVGDGFDLLNVRFTREVTRLAVAIAASLAGPVHRGGTPGDVTLQLARVLPNPSSGDVSIRYVVPEGHQGTVTLRIYDVRGRLVRALVNGETGSGVHDVGWMGEDGGGASVPPGIFFLRLEAGRHVVTSKLARIE